MKIIPPTVIDDSSLVTATIQEPSADELADPDYRGLWDAITTYMVNAVVIVEATHKKYVSLKNDNLNWIPGDSGSETWWLEIGYSDRWKAFDDIVNDQIEYASVISYTLTPGIPIDSVAILNIEAETVKVTFTDTGGTGATTVWNETVMVDDLYVPDVAKTDFPLTYLTPTILIELTPATGATCKMGEIVIGCSKSLGGTKWSPSVGIIDYSLKQVDTFGNYTVLERAYSKRMSCSTNVLNSLLDTVFNTLALYRATPVVWVGHEDYSSLIVFGFYKDFSIDIPYLKYSVCSLEIEGLV